jgi:hemerythrin
MRIEWRDSYKIGNAEIDAQHQEWFGKINGFLEATDQDSLVLCEMSMYQYTRVHFRHEETLMRSLKYPGMGDHVAKHNEMLSHLNAISEQIANFTLDRKKWKDFLSDWLLNHIATIDTQLAEFIDQK